MRIILREEARRQFEKVEEWWRMHRDTPDLFVDEFEQALRHLETAPESGQPHRKMRGRLIRRWLLTKSRYHVYYCFEQTTDVLEILTIWSAARGHGPPL